MRKIQHKESFVVPVDKLLDHDVNHGKLLHKKLQMYEELDKTIKYTKPNKQLRVSIPTVEIEEQPKKTPVLQE